MYIDKEFDCEYHLPLTLYAYQTAAHSSTGVSPHLLAISRESHALLFNLTLAFDPGSYQHYLRGKLADLQDLVASNLVKAADQQKHYDKQSLVPSFI